MNETSGRSKGAVVELNAVAAAAATAQ